MISSGSAHASWALGSTEQSPCPQGLWGLGWGRTGLPAPGSRQRAAHTHPGAQGSPGATVGGASPLPPLFRPHRRVPEPVAARLPTDPPWQPTRWPRASAPVISCRRFFGRSLAPSLLLCLKELGFGGLVTPSEALVSPGDSVLTRHFLLLSLITGGSHVEEQGTRPACVLPPPPRQQSPGSPDSPFSAPRPHGWRGHGLTRPPSCVWVPGPQVTDSTFP